MKQAGLQCSVLNIDPRAPRADGYIKISGAVDLVTQLVRHVYNDWVLSVHTNGHNPKSWLIALICGVAAQFGPGATLTLHSGILPEYLRGQSAWRRAIAGVTCMLYDRVVCVNTEIAATIAALGISQRRLEITPAFLPITAPDISIPERLEIWIRRHSPMISATMFFRPEYGFELLLQAMSVVRQRFPGVGCLIMGSSGGREPAESLVIEHGLRDTVLFAGDLDHELCLAIMARSHVFVRPTYQDGDSISVREAMSLRIPVVASNVGTRPLGAFLFEAGNLDGLIEQIERVLDAAAL